MVIHHSRNWYCILCRVCLITLHYRKDYRYSNLAASAASFSIYVALAPTDPPDLLVAPLVDAQLLEFLRERLHRRCITDYEPIRCLLLVRGRKNDPRWSSRLLFRHLTFGIRKCSEHLYLMNYKGSKPNRAKLAQSRKQINIYRFDHLGSDRCHRLLIPPKFSRFRYYWLLIGTRSERRISFVKQT